ncbi:N5-glutamine S-adenosyl-L-methionine-dependent methyltransferase [Listeria grandensis FSL F6-0971]|uniref:Release factor glutamine methyltransferase n=1 Tax=Listeria grandensis FSL F6-0971 TaxID=1265819 RepID=W7BH66_9LIST|nr:peptide chain release factor N(5)-glutamine methyltransferase [Listeria grandensis]EUJ24145.1 N5-glutamine S-adenosyl-L-methionine-dependent methyltransferase [Listeria grandensis FSL F6-0971]
MTIAEILHQAKAELTTRGLDLNIAEILIETRLDLTRSDLWMSTDRELGPSEQAQFDADFARYINGEPVQYILEVAPFYGRNFYVTPSVLIPRPETEELVYAAEKFIEKKPNRVRRVLDVCTGSGIIPITLKATFPELAVTGSDISVPALEVAEKNSKQLQTDVHFIHSDLVEYFQQNGEKFDMILANPPYIADDERAEMSAYVLNHEPELALFAPNDGLAIYEKLIENLPDIVDNSFWIGMEIGYTQGEAVKQLFEKSFPQATTTVQQDINGKDRMVICVYERI